MAPISPPTAELQLSPTTERSSYPQHQLHLYIRILYHRPINTHVKITLNSFDLFIQNTDHKLSRATTDRSNTLVYILLLGFRPFGATGSQENGSNNRILRSINGPTDMYSTIDLHLITGSPTACVTANHGDALWLVDRTECSKF